ncbi:hypothetical protein GCM10009805_05810 [Leucobacter chromiireducens subsp. solipictus]
MGVAVTQPQLTPFAPARAPQSARLPTAQPAGDSRKPRRFFPETGLGRRISEVLGDAAGRLQGEPGRAIGAGREKGCGRAQRARPPLNPQEIHENLGDFFPKSDLDAGSPGF